MFADSTANTRGICGIDLGSPVSTCEEKRNIAIEVMDAELEVRQRSDRYSAVRIDFSMISFLLAWGAFIAVALANDVLPWERWLTATVGLIGGLVFARPVLVGVNPTKHSEAFGRLREARLASIEADYRDCLNRTQ